MLCYWRYDTFRQFDTAHECDRQTDRQTGRITVEYGTVSK